jgi:hypothetical protein
MVRRGSTVTLDASSSYDPDSCIYIQDPATGQYVCGESNSNSILVFTWECSNQGVACIFKSGKGALSSASSTILDLAQLILPSQEAGEITITVSVTRASGGGSSTSRASVKISITDVPMVDLQIRPMYVTAGRCAYSAVIGSADGVWRYSWSVVSVGHNAGQTTQVYVNTDDAGTFLAGSAGSAFVIRLDSPYASAFLSVPGASFTISLTVEDSNSGMKGQAYFEVLRPVPPSGGTCSAAPTNGISLTTPFVISCSDWSSELLPLAYSFSSRPASMNNNDASISWSTPTAAASYDLYLTSGNYSLAVSISDDVGTASIVDAAEEVLVQTNGGNKSSAVATVDSGALSLLADSLVAKGRVGGATIMVDGVASGVNEGSPAVAADCSSNGGCDSRRLLSSSAYRMSLRRLLLGKLRRLSSIVSGRLGDTRAPAVLRAARRTASAPSELGWEGAVEAMSSLAATLGTFDLRALRLPGTLSDAARLSARTLAAVKSNSDGGQLIEMTSRASTAVLGVGERYVQGMIPGESPVEVQARGTGRTSSGLLTLNMARDITGRGVEVHWQASTASSLRNERTGMYKYAVDFLRRQIGTTTDFVNLSSPAGLAVVRMGVALGLPTARSSGSTAATSQVLEFNQTCTTKKLKYTNLN